MASGWMGLGEKWRDYKQIFKKDLFFRNHHDFDENREVRHGMEVKTFFFLENTMTLGRKYIF